MEDYEILTRLGGGTFADVYKAIEKSTNEIVAIKTLKKKYKKWEDCLELRECKSLQKLQDDSLSTEKGFEYIVKLKRILFIKKTNTLNLIFEYMDKDLLEQMKFLEPKTLTEQQIKNFIYQILLGLSHMHKYGFFHRDMKPENILIKNNNLAKIADFGLAREIRSLPPYTEYVSTRYYRAPECLLKFNNYNSPIDIWALGCIMAEMYLHPQPLFCGNNEKEVLLKICYVLGSPNYENWADGVQQANILGIKFPNNSGVDLKNVIKNASDKSIDLLKLMLQWDPNKRPNANFLLNHCFFDDCKNNENIKNDKNDINNTINISKLVEDIEKYKKFNNTNESSIQKDFNINNSSNLNLKQSGCYENINNISKILNDTDCFDNLLNQLKKEKSEEDKEFYEKNEKDKSKFYFNDFDVSNIIVNGNDNTNFSINKSNTFFNQSLKINPNKSNNVIDTDFSYVATNGNNTNQLNENSEDIKDDKKIDENQKNNNNNKNEEIISSNKENNKQEENDFDFDFNDKELIKTQRTNRIRSARKFLEETEDKFNCEKSKRLSYYGKGFIKPNNNNIKYNYNENNNEKNLNNKLLKNDYEDLNRMIDISRKKFGIIENDFIKTGFNFMKNDINAMNQKIINKETRFHIGGRRNYLPNNNAIWGI